MSNDENVVLNNETTPNTTFDDTVKKPKKNKKLIIIILVALVVLCLGFGGFIFYNGRPKRIVSNVINKLYKDYDKAMNNTLDFDPLKDSYKMEGTLTVDTNIDGFEDLNKEKVGFTLGMDYPNNKIEAGASLTEESKTIVDAMIYIIKDTMYATLGDDYKNAIKLGSDDEISEVFDISELENINISKDDINYIVKAYKNILIDSIDEKDLKKSTDTIEVDGKDVKVNKVTYKINDKNLEKLTKKMIDGMLDDKELLKKLSNIADIDVDDLKDELKEAKKDIEIDEDINMSLNFYTKGVLNTYVGMEFKGEGFSIKSTKIDDDKTDIEIEIESLLTAEINVKESSDEKFDADFKIKAAGETISGSITTTSKETKKDNYKGTFAFSIKYNDYKFKLDMDYTLELNANIADIDTKNAVEYSENDEELNKAINDIADRLQKSNIYSIIEGLSDMYNDTFNNTYDYDYDYDLDDYDLDDYNLDDFNLDDYNFNLN